MSKVQDLNEIKKSGIDNLIVSLNTHSGEKYKKITGGLDFNKAVQNINRVCSEKKLQKKITVSFVITDDIADEVKAGLEYWKQKGIKTRTIDLSNRAGTLKSYKNLKTKSPVYYGSIVARSWKNIIKAILGFTGCIEPFYHLNVLWNGDIILCCHDWNRNAILGNIETNTIKEIWNTERFNTIRLNILKKKYKDLVSCKGCSLAT